MSTTNSIPDCFPLFPYLPGELRALIWKHAVEPYRVLRITLYQKDFPPNPQLPPSSQFLGSAVYGPPWNVKVGCTDALVAATRRVRDLMLVSREAYRDITDYILPDRIHVTVDWDPPYLQGMHMFASKGEKVYKIPWNRKTERVYLEMVHLKWDTHESGGMREGMWERTREEIPRGSDLPAPPVWVNEVGYEPFGQDPESNSESDPDESRDPSRPSRFYVPPADSIAATTVPEPNPDSDQELHIDPRVPGEIYIPHTLAHVIIRRHISLAPILTRLAPVAYRSLIPLVLLCKILRVTNITIIADSILYSNLPAGPSPAWVDEHKVLHEPRIAELSRLSTALADLLDSETSTTQTQLQTQSQTQTRHEVLAHELRAMSLSPADLRRIRFFRLRDPNPPPAQDSRRNARETQRVRGGGRGEWGTGRPGTSNWAGARNEGDQNRGHEMSRREGQYGGFGSRRGWWAYPGEGRGRLWGPGGMGSGVGVGYGYAGPGGGGGGVGWESLGAMGAMGSGRVLDASPPVTSMGRSWGSGSGLGSGFSGFERP
ncbi:hypothetical protein NEUTE2DRAFT_126906 [Neurospora tetrasperma FGSC 2509]|nr:hypothetical protein NEUTE2DRAFT_126906 [Neurospora tetrasperma FGSC 2509]